jgi:hypothetical protein
MDDRTEHRAYPINNATAALNRGCRGHGPLAGSSRGVPWITSAGRAGGQEDAPNEDDAR